MEKSPVGALERVKKWGKQKLLAYQIKRAQNSELSPKKLLKFLRSPHPKIRKAAFKNLLSQNPLTPPRAEYPYAMTHEIKPYPLLECYQEVFSPRFSEQEKKQAFQRLALKINLATAGSIAEVVLKGETSNALKNDLIKRMVEEYQKAEPLRPSKRQGFFHMLGRQESELVKQVHALWSEHKPGDYTKEGKRLHENSIALEGNKEITEVFVRDYNLTNLHGFTGNHIERVVGYRINGFFFML